MDEKLPLVEEGAAPQSPDSRHRLRQAFFSAPRGIHIVLLGICFSLGFAIASQVIAQREDPFESLSQQDLVVLLEELSDREDALRSERADLTSQLAALEDSATKREAAIKAAQEARALARINAAVVPVEGPGITMIVKDPQGTLTASQFVMAIGELRNAGAEAASINGVRLTMRSAFTMCEGHVCVDGQRLSPPYLWNVIGESQTVATALDIPGGSATQMRAKGADVTINRLELVQIDAVAQPFAPSLAQIE